MKRILVPVDGSETTKKACEYAKGVAEKFEAEIIIFNVQDIAPPFGWIYEPTTTKNERIDPEKIAEEIVKDAKKYFNQTNIRVTTMTSLGHPASAIIDAAEREKCDLIIMCTNNMSKGKKFLIGSVTNKVVQHSKIPVLVIR